LKYIAIKIQYLFDITTRHTRVLVAASAYVWFAGCGGASLESSAAREPKVVTTGQGIHVSAVPRPTPDVVYLALWIDAGSRDASPPQLATVAAWIAAGRTGGNIRVDTTPDGIALSLRCYAKSAVSCLKRLREALTTRDTDETQAQQALVRLVWARRLAEAADPRREADRLALTALLGRQAMGFFPFGVKEDDGAVTAKAIKGFFRDHFGPERSFLVAVGDVDEGDFVDVVQEVFRGAPRAQRPRAMRDFRGLSRGGVKTALDAVSAVSAAAFAPDLETATALARVLSTSMALSGSAPVKGPAGFAVRVRGGALALARTAADEPAKVVNETAFEYGRLKKEGIRRVDVAAKGSSLSDLARDAGLKWCAQGGYPLTGTFGPGLGVLVSAGRGPQKASGTEPDAEQSERAGEQMDRAFAEGERRAAEARVTGAVETRLASVTATNGARIEVRGRQSERVAVAIGFAGGSAFDPAPLHGRSALLATLTTTACRQQPADRLTGRLEALDATLRASVDSDSWGLVLTAPTRVWRDALELALGCALYPSLTPNDIISARLRLRSRLGSAGSAYWFLNRAAQQVSPALPGRVAFWGAPASIAGVSDAELAKFADQAIVGSRLTVAVVGEVPVQEVVERTVRRVAVLPRGALAQRLLPPTKKSDPKTFKGAPVQELAAVGQKNDGNMAPRLKENDTGGYWVVVTWRAPGLVDGVEGARAFAALMRAALNQRAGVNALWADGGSDDAGLWAALGLRLLSTAVPSLDQVLGEVGQTVAKKAFDESIERIAEQALMAQLEAGARPEVEAERLAQNRVQEGKKNRSFPAIRQGARAFVSATARWRFASPSEF
jgi:predicted Zn-dependent peptidase